MTSSESIHSSTHIVKLGEHNYHEWKFNAQALLIKHAVWLYVNGTFVEPSNRADSEWKEWAKANMTAAGLLYQNVEASIQPIILSAANSDLVMGAEQVMLAQNDEAHARSPQGRVMSARRIIFEHIQRT